MSCQIKQAIELLKKEKPTVYNKIQKEIKKLASKNETNGVRDENVKYQKSNKLNTNTKKFDKELDEKLRGILQKLYPEIKLEYTEQEILHGEGVMNQEIVDNTIKFSLKVVEALTDWAAVKPSKHGGESQSVLSTIRVAQEAGVRKRLANKGVQKEQVDFVFEYMRQNDIGEIGTKQLAERVLLGLGTNVEVNTAKKAESLVDYNEEENTYEPVESKDFTDEDSDYYKQLTVPGGTNYKEMEIATPSTVAPKKGHADFATESGIGWYRVDDSVAQGKTLRVLEIQSDMFQKMKEQDLTKDNAIIAGKKTWEYSKSKDLNKSFLQLLNTDNKWVKFFIQSIVQDSQKKGYKKIKFPSGETAANIEGHASIAGRLRAVDSEIKSLKAFTTKEEYIEELISKEITRLNDIISKNAIPLRVKGAKRQLISLKEDPSVYFKAEIFKYTNKDSRINTLENQKAELKAQGIEKLAPIEGFYQVRVYNTLVKTYGKENVKTVTDERGNGWFELELNSRRDGNVIMLQQQEGKIKGQANIEAKTVLINSLLQSQDTLPHEYAHHYIHWFRAAPIVQEAIKKWGSEEELVQAIGEQVVKQKGEAYGWWEKFSNWLKDLFGSLDKATKEELTNLLTDAFLTNTDLNKMPSYTTQIERNKDVVLGSEEYAQMGDRGVGNETAYARMKQRTQDTYDYWKSQIGKEDYSNSQTVKNVRISNGVVIVSYNKGVDVRKQSIATLQNEDTTEIPTAKEEYLQSDVLNTTEGIISLFTELADNSINVSKEYKELIISLLGKIDPQFLPNLKIYLNKEASKTGGVLDGKNIIVDVSVGELDANNAMTGAQVYAHEMIHAISKFAIETSRENTEAYNIIRQIMILRDKAQKAFTKNGELDYTVLLPKVSIDTAKEKTIAIKRINYIFNNANGIHEFIAHALTNPEFMAALDKLTIGNKSKDGKGIVRILKELWENLIDIVLGENTFKDIGTTYREAVLRLVFELTLYNNAAVVKVDRKRTLGETLIRTIDKVGNEPLAKLIDAIGDKLNQQDIKTPPKNATKMQYRLWAIKYLPQLLLRKDMEGIREQVLDVLGMSPDGAIMSIVRDLEDASGLERIVEQLGMDSDQIDRHRMMTVDSVHLMIQDKFKVPPTELEEEVMTSLILDTDLSTIYKEYGVDIVENIIRDARLLQKSIDKETKALEELKPEDMKWFTAQVQGLGVYLATGKSGIAQYLNVENIAKEVNVRDKEVIKLLDKLATLYAIKNTSKTAKEEFINIMSKEEAGVTYLVELQALTKRESDRVFDTGTNKIKGYSKELFDDSIDIKIGLVSDEKKMANEGFKLKEILVKDPNDSNTHLMALYVSNTYIVNSYNIHAVRITDTNRRGTSLTDIAFMTEGKDSKVVANADIKRLKRTRLKAIREMKEGVYVVNDEDKLSPIMDDAGNVVDFRYMMGKYSKKIYLKQETKITDVMGRTIASVQDKVDTDIQNKAVLEVIHADMEENYIPGFKNGKNGKRYIKIEKDSLNFKVAEIYKILPHSMLEAIKDSDEGYIAVRQDMLHNYFGFRDPSIMDHIWLTPLNRHYIGRIIRLAEKLWQEIVKISKIDIVIRTPAVFIGNVISNFMYSVINHMSIKEVFKLQVASFRNLNRYLEMEKKLEQLRIENKLGAKNDNIIRRLEKEQKLNPVYDLMEAGMYQAIVEDLGQREFKSSSKLARAIDTKTKNMPTWVKNGVNWLYITEKTGLFQTMTKATQMSDFVARATEYELLQRRGVSKEDAKLIVLDAFVNYSKPSSSREEYLNNMGLFMFTKYAKRIQRAIRHSGKKKPLNIILSAIGQEYFFDLDDIYDQSIFTRSYNNFDQDMFEHIKRVIFPTTLEIVF